MGDGPPRPSGPQSHLSRISTLWPHLGDASRFSLTYGPAIQKYLCMLLRDPHEADEVAQDFFVRVLQHGFANATPDRGRFRDYLKTALRNAALTWMERKRAPREQRSDLLGVPAPEGPDVDEAWIAEWRECILGRAWQALARHERKERGNQCHTVLRLSADHPGEDSATLAARVKTRDGAPMSVNAFRQQLRRARLFFAEQVAEEVARTLDAPTKDRVEEELIELGLMPYVRELLPERWTPQGNPDSRP